MLKSCLVSEDLVKILQIINYQERYQWRTRDISMEEILQDKLWISPLISTDFTRLSRYMSSPECTPQIWFQRTEFKKSWLEHTKNFRSKDITYGLKLFRIFWGITYKELPYFSSVSKMGYAVRRINGKRIVSNNIFNRKITRFHFGLNCIQKSKDIENILDQKFRLISTI